MFASASSIVAGRWPGRSGIAGSAVFEGRQARAAGMSDAVLEHMRTRYRVDAHWLPNRQSAQTLADQATAWGRMAGPADSKTWVGLPLAVHRRCDKPMH